MGGRWFSLHDVDRSGGRIRRVGLGSPAATHRFFVQADRGRWEFKLEPNDRSLDTASLERQLQAATYRMPVAVARDGP